MTARLVSYVTGAAGEDGFAGLVGGHGARNGLLTYGNSDLEGTLVEFTRTDTDETASVVFRSSALPAVGPAARHLPDLIDRTATDEERAAFATAWHDRVERILRGEEYVFVDRGSS